MALHQDTDSAPTGYSASTGDRDVILWEPSLYPVCNIPNHHPGSIHLQDVSASTTNARVILHDNAAPVHDFLASTPHVPSSSIPAPLYVDEDILDTPLLGNNASVSASFQFHPPHWRQTAMESLPSPGTSPDPVATSPTRDIDTPARTTHLFTSEPSVSTAPPKSKTSTSPPDSDAVAVEHTADSHALSDDLDVPSSPSPIPVIDNTMLPTESPSSMLVPTTPLASPPLSNSAPDLGAAGEDEDNPNAGFRKGKDAHRPTSSAICENIVPEPPPQSLSQPSVTGVAIGGPSRSPDAKHTGYHYLQPPHGRDDIV